MSKLNGQIAIVTGVSHELGIGAAICLTFRTEWKVFGPDY